jgi:hypothetical protein
MLEVFFCIEFMFSFFVIVLFLSVFFTLLQEEGWLMGVKEGSGEKGMFPANFTRPL